MRERESGERGGDRGGEIKKEIEEERWSERKRGREVKVKIALGSHPTHETASHFNKSLLPGLLALPSSLMHSH